MPSWNLREMCQRKFIFPLIQIVGTWYTKSPKKLVSRDLVFVKVKERVGIKVRSEVGTKVEVKV